MKLPVFRIPVSVKAVTTALVAFIVGTVEPQIGINVSQSLNTLIASGLGLLVGFVVPEGAKFIDYWLKSRGIPAEIDAKR